jgi:hypothetical protein
MRLNTTSTSSLAALFLMLATVNSHALTLKELIGGWVSEASNERIEFRGNGDVVDFRLGQGRFSQNIPLGAANLAIVYQGNQWCLYYATQSTDGRSLFLARRNPNQDQWLCSEGRFTRVR